jgi:non-heme chloroperoxidase
MTFVAKTIELQSGVRLPYVAQGEPSGVPMLLLHGVTDSWRSFECVLPHLPQSIHAISLTQRGHGDADRSTSYRTRDFAADLAGFADALGLGPALIVGHSMGSTNALRFAIDYPERTSGSFASYRDNPAVVEFWTSAVSQLTDPIDPGFVRDFQESTLGRPVPGAFLEIMIQESLKVPARVWRAAFEGFLEDDFAGELSRIEAPTLILWGDQDALCSSGDQDALLAAIPGSRLIVYEGAACTALGRARALRGRYCRVR